MGVLEVMVQTLLQHGLAVFILQPVRHGVEALKIARHPAGALFGAASALAHGLVSPLLWGYPIAAW